MAKNNYKVSVLYTNNRSEEKAVKAAHKYGDYTWFLKTIPLNQLENVKSIFFEQNSRSATLRQNNFI